MADESRPVDGPLVSDCPIQPHVWREFRTRDRARLELIAHVRPDDSAPQVAATLREWLPYSESAGNSIFTFDVYVLVEIGFEEMVTALLPLTGWADLLRRVAGLEGEELQREIDAARLRNAEGTTGQSPLPPAGPDIERHRVTSRVSAELSHEDYGRLRWLLAQVVAVLPNITGSDLLQMLNVAIERVPNGPGPLLSVSYNRSVEPAVAQTRKTIKADAAESLFQVDCSSLTWAVIDTGIDRDHPMFVDTAMPPGGAPVSRVIERYDIPAGLAAFRQRTANAMYSGISTDAEWEQFAAKARVIGGDADRFATAANDHGTHVAGILAGGPHRRADLKDHWKKDVRGDEPEELRGICPTLRLIDIRVFDYKGRSREFEVVVGLAFLGWLNRRRTFRLDGVNISLSIPFAIDSFACGWSPVCLECERLVSAGVVVIASAGNSGYDDSRGPMSIGSGFQLISISDPGNADGVITVGATHRTDPHRVGPTSRSARGPTADGRNKPDLLAPGIEVWGPVPNGGWGRKSGTSQAAPHVSGVAAMLLARYPELRGRPDRVKEILCETATDLRRLVDFQGHGLVDALRALQRP
jgi:hypothetical protein